MCGILGVVNFSGSINEEGFEESLDMMEHRGPDDKGLYHDKFIRLGHRRLSILDLHQHSKQPMVSTCEDYIVVFNGEIYNYIEIRELLKNKGYDFITDSDTEVLLKAFIEFGIDCIESFIGMFSFAIYDKSKKEVFLVRDRLGIKPLFFSEFEDGIVFSSEVKSILNYTNIKREINLDAVSSYLSFRYPILEDTFFKGINSVAPGYYIKVSSTGFEKVHYWDPSSLFKEQKNDKGEQFYKVKLRELLQSSVTLRMRSDVPFGAYLSGGVDSSIITALMANQVGNDLKTYTIGFEEEGYNEFSYARLVADRYNTDHKEILVSSKSYIETMKQLILFKDAPLSVPNEVPLYLMSKELKKDITVVLSGEGADEIFGGYGRIMRSPHDYSLIMKLNDESLSANIKKIIEKKLLIKYGRTKFKDELDHFLSLYRYTSVNQKKSFLNKKIDIDEIESRLVKKFQYHFDELKDESYYNKIMYTFEKIHILGLLQRVDITTMATSVEARVPFVDHRLVEFAFTIPLKYKLKWKKGLEDSSANFISDEISENLDTPKAILKEVFEQDLPYENLYRKKMGFPVPLNHFFGGDFRDYAKSVLLSEKAQTRGIFDCDELRKLLNSDSLKEKHSLSLKVWMLINLELFFQSYFDNVC